MNEPQNYRKTNIILLLLTLVMIIGLVGTTYAFYTSSNSLDNMLITKGSEVYLQEYFSPNDLWVPGETKTKEVWFGNQSEVNQVIRFRVIEEWFDNNGTPLDLSDDTPWSYSGFYSPPPVTINWTSAITGPGAQWTKIGDYYYYNQVLAGQTGATPTQTSPVISSVTFSTALPNSIIHNTAEDFSDKACRLTIEMHALNVSSDITLSAWSVSFTQSGSALTWIP